MSDSFLLATRIPMSRADFERWLTTPVRDGDLVANPEAMFDGWFWDGSPSRWSPADGALSPREFFADRVEAACEGGAVTDVLGYRDGALEAYLMDFGFDESEVSTALLMFAAAGRFTTAPVPVLFWAETGANLGDADWEGRLAVLTVGRETARFTGRVDLTAVIEGLRPAEDRFFALVERLAEAEEDWDGEGSYRTDAPRDPSFIDAAVLATG